ncbi:1-acyl-sn-glycerol-3-phosphate acyltransferase [Thiotrichales bacterium 19S3-7]|nr:1-acyl-sn-glycerol-3-phosphate acyltransferase [Thiotrichales bacterium 19S3-7]MCF6802195.1 1-acyl-sn-glycerol-3-phosphate acyltransferase [Thiotrichales bacterium 19S3-11]
MKCLNYIWRLMATAVAFSTFGIGALVLAYITIPLIILCSDKSKVKLRVQYAISVNFRLFVLLMQTLGLANFSFEGKASLLNDKSTLFIANHPSLIDYVVITSALRNCDNIVKAKLWQNFFVKRVIQAAGYIANEQSEQTLSKISTSLASGSNILLFPEGTRSVVDQPIQLKRGAAQIAIRLNVAIRLIYITCQPRTLTKELKWYQIPDRCVDFRVVVGEKIIPQKFLDDAEQLPSLAARRLTKYLEEKLTEGSSSYE